MPLPTSFGVSGLEEMQKKIKTFMERLEDQMWQEFLDPHPNCRCVPTGITSMPQQKPVIQFSVHPDMDAFTKTVVASMKLSERELAVSKDDVMDHVRRRLIDHLEAEVQALIFTQDIHEVAKKLAKEVLRDMLKEALQAKVDELVEDIDL